MSAATPSSPSLFVSKASVASYGSPASYTADSIPSSPLVSPIKVTTATAPAPSLNQRLTQVQTTHQAVTKEFVDKAQAVVDQALSSFKKI